MLPKLRPFPLSPRRNDDRVDKDGYTVSHLNVASPEGTRRLVHFWFNTWPDHGVPSRNGQMCVPCAPLSPHHCLPHVHTLLAP